MFFDRCCPPLGAFQRCLPKDHSYQVEWKNYVQERRLDLGVRQTIQPKAPKAWVLVSGSILSLGASDRACKLSPS